jgi:hypothetical protein
MAPTLLIITGPPAVGKMAVGHEIATRTGLRLFHNHLAIEPVLRRNEGEFRLDNTHLPPAAAAEQVIGHFKYRAGGTGHFPMISAAGTLLRCFLRESYSAADTS